MNNKLLVFLLSLVQVHCEYVRVCYYTSWSQYRSGLGEFWPDIDIDPFLCTHIVYAFAKIEGTTLTKHEWNDEKLYGQIANLKIVNPNLKILLAVGGWNHESGFQKFSYMVNTAWRRNEFISGAVQYLRDHKFDGLDLDWEYPAQRGSPPEDKFKFTTLCKELREAFLNEASSTGNSRLLLTAAVSASSTKILDSYEADKLGAYLDGLHLMSYDLHGSWDPVTGHQTTLDPNDQFSVIKGLDTWINGGFPKGKIALGLGNYGRSFTLTNSANNGLNAPASGAGSQAPYTKEAGYISYYEICSKIASGMTVVHENVAKAPYGFLGSYWVGFDDETSMRYKVSTIIKARKLQGAMFWALPLDDFGGTFCDSGKYPLMNAVKDELTATETTLTPSTTTSTTATTTTTTTTITNPAGKCFAINTHYGDPFYDQWCEESCPEFCPEPFCSCDPLWKPWTHCFGVGSYENNAEHDQWCNDNCAVGNCPDTCSCDVKTTSTSSTQTTPPTTTTTTTTPTTTTTTTSPTTTTCHGIPPYNTQVGIDEYCVTNCALGHCPATHCACD